MWYRSLFTDKIVHESAKKPIDNLYGSGTFEFLVKTDFLAPNENPNIIDVLRDTDSTHLAVIRYREIHNCSIREAKRGVEILKRDLANFKKKGSNAKKWKKNAARTASTEKTSDTSK